jgi:tRNA (guanine37-N1)-methyltransferase
MRITVCTLFPEMIRGPLDLSIIGKAQKNNAVSISYINIRDYATDSYKTVDGKPYGGGHGMILRVDILARCIEDVIKKSAITRSKTHIILTDPRGEILSQPKLHSLKTYDHIIIIAGHYEGVDERVSYLIDSKISIGKYVLTGGEIPAMVIIDAFIRLLPGVLRNSVSYEDESFSANDKTEYPQYTAPRSWSGHEVPEILLSGHHSNIQKWKQEHKEVFPKTKKITVKKLG